MRDWATNGELELAINIGRRVLATDPYRESLQREVMSLLVHDGRRAEALRAYNRLKDLLQDELSIDPMPDTTALYENIRLLAVSSG